MFRLRNHILKNMVLIALTFTSVFSLTGCDSQMGKPLYIQDPVVITDFKLNTYVSVASYTTGGYTTSELKEVLKQSLSLCDHYEKMFSRTMEGGDLYRLNAGQTDIVPQEVGILIENGLKYADISKGAFDITVGSVSSLWDFNSNNPKIPPQKDIENGLKSVDYKKISVIKQSDSTYRIEKPDDVIIDLGAIAKGYIADKIKEFLIEKNITQGIVNLGGNVLCIGAKKDNASYNIAIRKPFEENASVAVLKISDMSVVSSGNYERYFKEDDKLYHHILNPKTGYPYDNNVSEVSIISKDSLTGDCLSTTCFCLGVEDGLKLIESIESVEAMFVDMNGNFSYSSGFGRYVND